MYRVEDAVLQPPLLRKSLGGVVLQLHESIVGALARVGELPWDEFPVAEKGYVLGCVRRADLQALANSERLNRVID